MASWLGHIAPWFGFKDKRQLKILTLVSKTQFEKKNYMLSFDVMKSTDCGKIKEMRRNEDEVYIELECIAGTLSSDLEMELSSKKCCFEIKVTGALQPATELEEGENILEYNESMSENRRHLYLKPTYDEKTDGLAQVKFLHMKKVRHTVTIRDVPVLKMSSTSLSTLSSDASLTQQTFRKCADGVDSDTLDFGPSGSTLKTATVKTSGSLILSAKNQAIPDYPNPRSGPTYVGVASDDDDVPVPEDCSGGDETVSAYDKILSNSSLMCLAGKLPPQDSEKLLILLQVQPEVIEHKKKDHPGDFVSAMASCLRSWRGEKKKSSKSKQHTNQQLSEELLKQLRAIGRNDIKSKILKVITDCRELEPNDLNHL